MRQAKIARGFKGRRWILLFFVAAILCIFRKSLILALVKIGLSYSLSGQSSSFTYETMQWESDCICIDSVCYTNPDTVILIDRVRIASLGNLFSWRVHCTLFQPDVQVKSERSEGPPLHFLSALGSDRISWEVHDGILHLDNNPPLYFTFLPSAMQRNNVKNHLGKIALSYEPESDRFPLFIAEIEEEEKDLLVDFSLIENDCSRLLALAQSLFPQIPKEWEERQGRVEAKGKVRMSLDGALTGLCCEWQIDDLSLKSPSNEIVLLAEHMSGSFASEDMQSRALLWYQGKAHMLFKGAEFYIHSLLPYRCCIEKGEVVFEPGQEPSIDLTGLCEYAGAFLAFSIHAQGEIHPDASIFLGFHGQCSQNDGENLILDGTIWCFDEGQYASEFHFSHLGFDHLAFFAPHMPFALEREYWIHRPADGKVHVLKENDSLQIDGEISFDQERMHVGVLLEGSSSTLKNGWFEIEKITESSYAPMLHRTCPDIDVTGTFQLTGKFDASQIYFTVKSPDCILHRYEGDLFLPLFGEQGTEFIYKIEEKKWQADIAISEASWKSQDPRWNLDAIQAMVHVDGTSASIPSFAALYQDWTVQGQVTSIDFDRAFHAVALEKTHLKWTRHIQDGEEIQFDVRVPQLYAALQKGESTCDFQLIFDRNQQCFCELTGSAQQKKEAGWEIVLDRQRTHFLTTPLNITGCRVSSNGCIAIEMHPVFSSDKLIKDLDWLSRAKWLFFNAENIKNFPFQAVFETKLATEDLTQGIAFQIQGRDIICNGHKIAPILLNGNTKGREIEIDACRGEGFTWKARMLFEENQLHLNDIEGQFLDVGVSGSGDIDIATRSFHLALDSMKGSLPSFKGAHWMSGTFAARGTFQGNFSSPFAVSGDAICTFDFTRPLGITAWNVKPLKISYAHQSGLCIEELCTYLKSKKEGAVIGLFSVGRCTLSSLFDAWQATDCECSIYSHAIQECIDSHLLPPLFQDVACADKIEISGDLHMSGEGLKCNAVLKDGHFRIKDTPLAFQKIGVQCQRGVLTVQGKTTIGEQPLWGALSVALNTNPQAILRITDDPQAEGVRLHCRWIDTRLHWEKIHGSCLGIQCMLSKNGAKQITGASVLTGHIDIDASRLSLLFPKTTAEKFVQFKLGKGYSWQGDLTLWQDTQRGFQMKGEITGDHWELLGYRFKELRAGVDMDSRRILFSNVQVADDAGTIAIKKASLEKKEHWELSVPIISIREWHPSSMHKVDASESRFKPFLIRNFTLSNIHADLPQWESLNGKGKLTFTNQCKKESTLLDTPLEMIKNFGLDPGLLTPVQGEIDIDLQGNKMYLVAMKDVYSEAKRSEFYLAPTRELSYIDLDGVIRIDLKMRQDVMLKITEPFILTIRGTLDNPRYGLNLLP